jgi:exopolysaccharide biosynthesis polyprenyl glycosylphosphotransferase
VEVQRIREAPDTAPAPAEADGTGDLTGPDARASRPRPASPAIDEPKPQIRGRDAPSLRGTLVAADILVLLGGWLVAVLLGDALAGHDTSFGEAAWTSTAVVAAGGILLGLSGPYRRRIAALRSLEFARIVRPVFALTVFAALVRVPAGGDVAAATAGIAGLLWALLLVLERGWLREWVITRRASGDFIEPVVVVAGAGDDAKETVEFLAANPFLGFDVRGVVSPHERIVDTATFPWHGPSVPAPHVLRRMGVAGIIVDNRNLTGDQLNRTVHDMATAGLHVHVASGLRGVERRRVTVSPLADETFLHVAPLELTGRQIAAKRAVDLVLGTVALILLSPVLAIAAAGVWATDRGPVTFRQRRVGLHGRTFMVNKLRTMVVDAEAQKHDLASANDRDGPLFKLAGDPRVTPVGRLLRATSVDEIPQLFNVLRGDMSLVGPRPALPEEAESFDDDLSRRVSVKPGVTGLWQVEARDSPNFDLYRRYDLLYVQNWSLGLDLTLIARTVAVVGLRGLRALTPGSRSAGSID